MIETGFTELPDMPAKPRARPEGRDHRERPSSRLPGG
jgi:hypothetical protein